MSAERIEILKLTLSFLESNRRRELKGEPGEPGLPGATGRRGDPGIPGIQGTKGDPGKDGADGKNGINGATGERGTDGEAGPVGVPGKRGQQGVQGPQGAKGDGFKWRGEYTAGTLYEPLDVVSFAGSSWVTRVSTRAQPGLGGWELMAERGQDGAAGRSGSSIVGPPTFAAAGSTPDPRGATIDGSGNVVLQPAGTTNPGLMSAADKTKLDAVTGTHTGTNTGDVTIGATPNGLSVAAGQVLSMAAAGAAAAGAVTTGVQTFAGTKTFSGAVSVNSLTATTAVSAVSLGLSSAATVGGSITSTVGIVTAGGTATLQIRSGVTDGASAVGVKTLITTSFATAGAIIHSFAHGGSTAANTVSIDRSGGFKVGLLTTTAINALAGADLREGTLVWDSTLHKLKIRTASGWELVTSA